MTSETRLEIFSVAFDVDAVIVGYMHVPTDVRVGGNVALQHQMRLDIGHPDYAEDADKLRNRARRMVENALEDFHDSEPYNPEDEDDDEDRGMGDG